MSAVTVRLVPTLRVSQLCCPEGDGQLQRPRAKDCLPLQPLPAKPLRAGSFGVAAESAAVVVAAAAVAVAGGAIVWLGAAVAPLDGA